MKISAQRITVLSLLLPFLPLVLAQVVFVSTYRTNDDIGMNMLAAGVGFESTPTPFLVFSHHLLGRLLNLGYSVSPSYISCRQKTGLKP